MALVDYRLADSIATIRMDDGKRNALSPQMFAELEGAFERARTDRAAVLWTGREGTFSAGFDLRVLGAGGPDAIRLLLTGFELAEKLLAFPAPIVIACPGHALAMGAFLLLSVDYRVGALGPHRIGANEVAIGLTMPRFGVEICRQRLTPSHFHRAVINAEIHSPESAVEAGFLDRAVALEELEPVARGIVTELAKLDRDVHTQTKLRARASALRAIREAIEADAAEFRARA
jgi:enoyl-CoA hydratase